jgi:fumarylacetoacetate (FAA) hydrolase
MRFATLTNDTRDGELVLVSSDHVHAVAVPTIARTLQAAIENWKSVEPALAREAQRLEAGDLRNAFRLAERRVTAPLPRAWQWLDGSAYESHGDLMQKVFNLDPIPKDRPLMYQGVSDRFYGPTDDVPFVSEKDGIDFEGEFGVIVDEVPIGTSAKDAEAHIRLVVQINDWSLRVLAPIEMRTGFGWVQAKPPCSVAPIAVTIDELGPAWRDGRVDLPLIIDLNGTRFGAASGYPMAYSFAELIAHSARTRTLCAGTLVGSGTVSNENYREVGSSCIAERRGIELVDHGAATFAYMRFGDRVRMEARLKSGEPLFGAIDQKVISI